MYWNVRNLTRKSPARRTELLPFLCGEGQENPGAPLRQRPVPCSLYGARLWYQRNRFVERNVGQAEAEGSQCKGHLCRYKGILPSRTFWLYLYFFRIGFALYRYGAVQNHFDGLEGNAVPKRQACFCRWYDSQQVPRRQRLQTIPFRKDKRRVWPHPQKQKSVWRAKPDTVFSGNIWIIQRSGTLAKRADGFSNASVYIWGDGTVFKGNGI